MSEKNPGFLDAWLCATLGEPCVGRADDIGCEYIIGTCSEKGLKPALRLTEHSPRVFNGENISLNQRVEQSGGDCAASDSSSIGRHDIPPANFGMIKAGLDALDELRRSGMTTKENGDANLVYGIYEAMRAERLCQISTSNDPIP